MYHFKYVTKAEARKVREKLENLVHEVQDEVRDNFTFQYYLIGSSARNMITYDPATNIGFDFDVNLEVNDNEEQYLAKEIRQTFEHAFQKVYGKYGYTHFENSKRVFTIKLYDSQKKKIIHSCDIAIVKNFIDEEGTAGQEYIAFDKKSNSYSWQQQSKSFNLKEKENWLRQQPEAWNAVRERYLKKKNQNQNIHKHSRSLYTETINEICKQYGFDDQLHSSDEKENQQRAEGFCSLQNMPMIKGNCANTGAINNTWRNHNHNGMHSLTEHTTGGLSWH